MPFWILLATTLVASAVAAWAFALLRNQRRKQEAAATSLQQEINRLRRLATRNETILEHAMDGFFVLDEQGRFIDVNPALCRMLGYERIALLDMKITDVENSGGLLNSTGLRTGLHSFPSTHRHRDGHLVQLESSVVILRDQDRKVLVGFARDVTQRAAAEEAVRKSESQYRNVVETSRDLIWSVDHAGNWRFLNAAANEIYGREPEAMIGKPMLEFVAADDATEMRRQWIEIKSAPRTQWIFDARHVREDGSLVDLTFNAIAVRDANGKLQELVGTARDVTKQRQFEAQLREAHARFEAIKNGIPLAYVVWSLDGEVREWNRAAAEIFGYPANDALGQPLQKLVAEDNDGEAFRTIREDLTAGARHTTQTVTNRRNDGTALTCEWFNTVLRNADDEPEFVASIVRDVTEKERLEGQLRQAQKMESLGVLAGGVAHDFNNLLVGIMGNISLAAESLQDRAACKRYLDNATNAADRATDLTKQMLTYAGKTQRNVRAVDINKNIREIASILQAAIPRSVAVEFDLGSDLPALEADPAQVQQIVMNLMINGAEACEDGLGTVTLRTRPAPAALPANGVMYDDRVQREIDYVALEVKDTGCGMTQETLQRIFEPFYSTKFTGRGLGLSAIRGIIRAHRGAIHVSSSPDEGTTFTVFLPVAKQREETDQDQSPRFEIPVGSTILVIDDEAEVRNVAQAVLESRGARVLVAEDGIRGVDMFKQQAKEIDAVLLDLTMPGMGGEDVYREIALLRPDARVIVSSGYSESETHEKFQHAPVAGFVHKPYTAEMLITKIGAVLSQN